ncbi:MAG: hypothetical protein JWM58_1690 [Rhizobium sp.]|nr:hypothetical protein [Rhizobium sp.]
MNKTFSSGVHAKCRTGGQFAMEHRFPDEMANEGGGWTSADAAAAVATLADNPILQLFAGGRIGIKMTSAARGNSIH